MASYSIYEDLTKLPSMPASSTETIDILVRSLAKQAGRNIRGPQTYYRIVSRAREIYEHIDGQIVEALIKKDWDKYDLSTLQTETLEELLFQIANVIDEETEAHLPLQPKSIQHCLDSITLWQNNREICRDVSRKLHTQPFEVTSPWDDDLKAAAYHDDLSWISAVCDSIPKAISSIRGKKSKSQRRTHSSLINLISNTRILLAEHSGIEERLLILITRCFMVMYGLSTIASDSGTSLDVLKRLKSSTIWNGALRLIKRLQNMLRDSSGSLDNLVDDWALYENRLLTSTEDIDGVLHRLPISACHVRRLCKAQCLVLTNLCLEIGQHIKTIGSEDGAKRLEGCVLHISKAMELLAASEVKLDEFDWDSLQKSPAGRVINAASTGIRRMYARYKANSRNVDKELLGALKKDKRITTILGEVVKQIPLSRVHNKISRKPVLFDPGSPAAQILSLEDYCLNLSVDTVHLADDDTASSTLDRILDHVRKILSLQVDNTSATDIIALLIHVYASKVIGVPGSITLFSLVTDRLKDICGKISESINEAEKAGGAAYSADTKGINRLEELLCELHDTGERLDATGPAKDIGGFLEAIEITEKWLRVNKEILVQLYAEPFDRLEEDAKLDTGLVLYRSDLEVLSIACSGVLGNASKIVGGHGSLDLSNLVFYLVAQARHIYGEEPRHEGAVLALTLRYMLLVNAILGLLDKHTVDSNVKEHLSSRNTWEHLYAFIENLYHAIETSTFTLQLTADWSEFELYLQNPEHKLVGHSSLIPFDATDFTKHWEKLDESPVATSPNSNVYKSQLIPGEHSCKEKLVSIKVLRTMRIKHDSVPASIMAKRLQREVQVWSQLNHSNVIPILGFALEGEHPCLLAPWCENGNVLVFIGEHPDADRSQIITDSINGLVYLHARNPPVIHGNLKASNILIDSEGHARLTDFGFRRSLEVEKMGSATPSGSTGTNRWMAPELLHEEQTRCTTASDVYSLVHLALAIYTQKTPFPHLDDLQFLLSIHKQESPQRSHYHPFNPPDEVWEVFEKGWLRTPEERPSADGFKDVFSEALGAKNWRCFFGPADLTGRWTKIGDSPRATGGHSDIYAAKLHEGSHPHKEQTVAVKVLRSIRIRPGSKAAAILHKRLQREVQVWSRLDHRNIVPFLGFAFYGNSPCMVAPWYKNGDIPDYLRKHPDADRTQLVSESIEGLVYLHTRKSPVIHGDIKASNILVDDEGHARITDFGLSRTMQAGRTGLTTSSDVIGTARWMAPELLLKDKSLPSAASDVYALSLVVLEIYTLQPPFPHLDQPQFYIHIYNQKSPERSHYDPFDPPEQIWDIFEKAWSFDPEKRPSVSSVKSMFAEALETTGWQFKPQPQSSELQDWSDQDSSAEDDNFGM